MCKCVCLCVCCCRLWEDGWKQRYYKTKFDVDVSDDGFRKKVVRSYVEGLCWVLRYYYQVIGTFWLNQNQNRDPSLVGSASAVAVHQY